MAMPMLSSMSSDTHTWTTRPKRCARTHPTLHGLGLRSPKAWSQIWGCSLLGLRLTQGHENRACDLLTCWAALHGMQTVRSDTADIHKQ